MVLASTRLAADGFECLELPRMRQLKRKGFSDSRIAKLVAFLTKLGALLFVLGLKTSYAIELQLLGGIWIGQTVPAVLLALYVRLNPIGLIAG